MVNIPILASPVPYSGQHILFINNLQIIGEYSLQKVNIKKIRGRDYVYFHFIGGLTINQTTITIIRPTIFRNIVAKIKSKTQSTPCLPLFSASL